MFENTKVNCKNQQDRGTESIIAAISAIDLIKAVFKEPHIGVVILAKGRVVSGYRAQGTLPLPFIQVLVRVRGGGEEMIELA